MQTIKFSKYFKQLDIAVRNDCYIIRDKYS